MVGHDCASRPLSARQPRFVLADEVGLGKTIEACLIVQRLLITGRARRVLILVPEPLTHQWFVELLRRFNLWFSIYDEARCADCEASDPGKNPFHAAQLALSSVTFLSHLEHRREQALAAGWDLVVIDEAHHLDWTPQQASPGYALVERLAATSPGLLLLTATPTQLGLRGGQRLQLLPRIPRAAARQSEIAGGRGIYRVRAGYSDAEDDRPDFQGAGNRPRKYLLRLRQIGDPGRRRANIEPFGRGPATKSDNQNPTRIAH